MSDEEEVTWDSFGEFLTTEAKVSDRNDPILPMSEENGSSEGVVSETSVSPQPEVQSQSENPLTDNNSTETRITKESIGEVPTAQVDGPADRKNRRTARPRRQQHEQFRGEDRVDAESGPALIDHLVNPKLIPEKRYVRFDEFHDIDSLPSKFSTLDDEHRRVEKLNDGDIMKLMWFKPNLRKQFQVAFDSAGQLRRKYWQLLDAKDKKGQDVFPPGLRKSNRRDDAIRDATIRNSALLTAGGQPRIKKPVSTKTVRDTRGQYVNPDRAQEEGIDIQEDTMLKPNTVEDSDAILARAHKGRGLKDKLVKEVQAAQHEHIKTTEAMQIQHAQYDRQITALVRTNKRLRQRCKETREHYFAAQVELNEYREKDGLGAIDGAFFSDDTDEEHEKAKKSKVDHIATTIVPPTSPEASS